MNIWSIAAGVAVFALVVSPVSATSFDDVGATHWAAPAINAITDAGIMEGCGGSFFCPYAFVTREELSVWLERAFRGVNFQPSQATGLFDDVPSNYCLAAWMEQLKNDGFTSGCSVDPPLFCPHHPVSRGEMAVFLLRLEHGAAYTPPPACAGGADPLFIDVPCSDWRAPWIEQTQDVDEGIMDACETNGQRFCPSAALSRAELAEYLTRVCQKSGAQCASAW